MKKRILKVLLVMILIIFAVSLLHSSFATGVLDNFDGNIADGAKSGSTKMTKILGMVLDAVRNVGAGIAVLILIVIGCKYVIASAGERADIKKNAVPYVIGAVVLFASSGIAGILKEFATAATEETTP